MSNRRDRPRPPIINLTLSSDPHAHSAAVETRMIRQVPTKGAESLSKRHGLSLWPAEIIRSEGSSVGPAPDSQQLCANQLADRDGLF